MAGPAHIPLRGAPAAVRFTQSTQTVEAYDFVEIRLEVDQPDAANPFTDVGVEGQFGREGQAPSRVEGFCDSSDGGLFRIRFMAAEAGTYRYAVTYRQGTFERAHEGVFEAKASGRQGSIRVDPEHPWHFVWEGTGEHYFWNGTTAYWLIGWDDQTIRESIDRLHSLRVNRIRAVLHGRVRDGRAWFENVYPTQQFSFALNPWVAARPDNVEDPGFDTRRFNVSHWQKYERMLEHAREKDMIISVIFYVDGRRPGVDPFGKANMGGEDEQRYYRYAIARLAAFSNVMWDITNEYHLFRDEAWVEKMGALIKQWDPYGHMTSVHGHGQFPFRTSAWADFAMYQQWDEGGGYPFMLRRRQEQAATGRPLPQVNEEYGYEDHYPAWGGNRKHPARTADNRRRLAWGMAMAGGYQTTGERADQGTGWGPDSGGGWINGRGDAAMTMLTGYGHLVEFFTGIEWWRLEPDSAFAQALPEASVMTELTHLVYTREPNGLAKFFLNGTEVSSRSVPGTFSNWEGQFRFALANELSGDRPWLGEFHRLAIYNRALDSQEISQSFRAGRDQTPLRAQVLYTFQEGRGDAVRDVSSTGEPLNLKISDPPRVEWRRGGGLEVKSPVLIASAGPARKLKELFQNENAITLEAWVVPRNATQTGPARIASFSHDTGSRNFTLGQAGPGFEMRLRTTRTSPNGEPALTTPGGSDLERYAAALRAPAGDLAVVYFSMGGAANINRGALTSGLQAHWFNPRTGRHTPLEMPASDRYQAPDGEDWVLLFR